MPEIGYELAACAFDLFTGAEQDRAEILALHQAYLDANTDRLNGEKLKKIWSDHPTCVFFNGNGHNYNGLAEWLPLWTYYGPRVEVIEPWKSWDVRLIGNDSTAVVTSLRTSNATWIGGGEAPEWTKRRWTTRSTEVFTKTDGYWRCSHIHISTGADGPRHETRASLEV
jgi:ketosteroid isomerase-like protein